MEMSADVVTEPCRCGECLHHPGTGIEREPADFRTYACPGCGQLLRGEVW